MLHARLGLFLFIVLFSSSVFALKWSDVYQVGVPAGNAGAGPTSIAMDSAGNVHILWNYSTPTTMDLYYGKVNSAGQLIVGPILVNHCNLNAGPGFCQPFAGSSMGVDSQNNVHVVWEEVTSVAGVVHDNIKYKKFSSSGQILITEKDIIPPADVQINNYYSPQIGIDKQDHIHFIWTQDGSVNYGTYYQTFTDTATPFTSALSIFSSVGGAQTELKMGADGSGNVLFTELNQVTNTYTLYYRKFAQSGVPIGGMVTLFSSSATLIEAPDMAVDASGQLHLGYTEVDATSPVYHSAIHYAKFNSSGNQLGTILTLAQFSNTDCYYLIPCARVAVLPSGEAEIVWVDNLGSNVFGATISPSGIQIGTSSIIAHADDLAFLPLSTADPNGTFHVAWTGISNISTPLVSYKVRYVHSFPEKAVILVHGIYSDDTIWDSVQTALQNQGYAVYRVGKVTNKKGLTPNNGEIILLSHQLRDAIQIVKTNTELSNVDVVAHSMGGLVTRAYIASNDYAGDINNLVMLGTPNEGAPIAAGNLAKILGLTGDSGNDFARKEMIPNSPFLKTLNKNYKQKGVHYSAVAGTFNTLGAIKKWSLCTIFPLMCPFLPSIPVSDSIVPEYSVNFIGYCTEAPVAHTSQLGPTYYTHSPTIQKTISLLKGDTSFPACPIPLVTAPSYNFETKIVQGTLAGSTTQTISPGGFYLDKTLSIGTQITGSASNTSVTLTSPSGQTVTAANVASLFSGAIYETETADGNTTSWFNIPNAPIGTWSASITNNTGTSRPYTMFILMTRPVKITPQTDATEYAPGQAIKVTASLSDDAGIPVLGWTVNATTQDNTGTNWNIQLFDDATHGDASANDGIYTNSFTPAGMDGVLVLTTTASGSYNGHAYNLTGMNTFSVIVAPDLFVAPTDVQLAPTGTAGQVSVSTTVKNNGNVAVSNAKINFYDGLPTEEGVLIGQATISLTPGQSVQASVPWALPTGVHTIYITPSSDNGFMDADYSNETATKVIGCRNHSSSGSGPIIKGCTVFP